MTGTSRGSKGLDMVSDCDFDLEFWNVVDECDIAFVSLVFYFGF